MKIDPREYDVAELRERSGQYDRMTDREDSKSRPVATESADEIMRSGQYRELFFLESAASNSALTKPYLDQLPDSYSGEILIFEWLEFLFDKTGYRDTLEALRYYESISWITAGVSEDLAEYLTGMDPGPGNEDGALSRSDHMSSLMYIGRLAAVAPPE